MTKNTPCKIFSLIFFRAVLIGTTMTWQCWFYEHLPHLSHVKSEESGPSERRCLFLQKSTSLALSGCVLCLAISAPRGFFCYTTCALKCFVFFALLNHMCSMNFVTPLVPQGVCSVSTLLFLHFFSKEFL